MKARILALTILMMAGFSATLSAQKSFYDFKVKDIYGKEFDFSTLKGKKVLIVNTASKCGYTPQYAGLEKLYKQYGKDGFVVVGFPSNDFGDKEPGNNKQIEEFCRENYSVTFPMMGKTDVKGDDIDPVYKWLTEKKENGKMDTKVAWNFQKYFVNEKGELVGYVSSKTEPDDPKIINFIEGKD